MADFRSCETRKIAATTTSKEENFVTGCKRVCVSSDADAFIDFDQPCDTGSFFIKGNQSPLMVDVQFTKISAMAVTTANVYILAIR